MGVFTTSDYTFSQSKGIDQVSLDQQWQQLNEGFATVKLLRPAAIGDGIERLTTEEEEKYIQIFDQAKDDFHLSKFVPASGAASRMFLPVREMREDPNSQPAQELLKNIKRFPFYEDLEKKAAEKGESIDAMLTDPVKLAEFILLEDGMDYDHYPKGLITFYNDGKEKSCAFEQQLDEAKVISSGHIHFTVAEEFIDDISTVLHEEKAHYSIQDPSTHYIAKHANEPLRNDEGELIFRPSGHGALLKNLNELDAEMVFIKNIDNIQIAAKNDASIKAKKILGGYLIMLKEAIDTFLYQLEEDENADLSEINQWIKTHLDSKIKELAKEELVEFLHRPIRVAGMVLNEGKAGGGPFWVKKKNGNSLQIVEAAQIDKKDAAQKAILEASTHFNPVDMVCSLTDHRDKKFDLDQYIDKESGFLSNKIINGKEVTIMERPGLWNGSMANWISVFIELPLASFTPVKTILDLLPSD
jgi:hypothetical protein